MRGRIHEGENKKGGKRTGVKSTHEIIDGGQRWTEWLKQKRQEE